MNPEKKHLMQRAIRFQTISESLEREDELLLIQMRRWLELETVDAQLREHMLLRIEQIFKELAKCRRQIKALMDLDNALAA